MDLPICHTLKYEQAVKGHEMSEGSQQQKRQRPKQTRNLEETEIEQGAENKNNKEAMINIFKGRREDIPTVKQEQHTTKKETFTESLEVRSIKIF